MFVPRCHGDPLDLPRIDPDIDIYSGDGGDALQSSHSVRKAKPQRAQHDHLLLAEIISGQQTCDVVTVKAVCARFLAPSSQALSDPRRTSLDPVPHADAALVLRSASYDSSSPRPPLVLRCPSLPHQAEVSPAMTEYDYSPEGYRQFQRTQQRIAHWTADTAHAAHQFKSPFLPRSDVQDNEFYNPRSRSGSSSRQHTPSPGHSHRPHSSHGHHGHGHGHRQMPERSYSSGAVQQAPAPFARSPLRSHTIAVSPDDSISQVSSRRARSHSPVGRAHGHGDRSSRGHYRSGTTYVVSPQPQYASIGAGMQVVYGQPPPQPQPAAYVVYPGERKVHIVYPEHPHAAYPAPAQQQHGSLLTRIFGERGRRSRSASHSHSHSRSSRR
ncbi:hypothetical protein GGX14DRAFT_699309 [Mycena pura]|uniref:Uncharacterized protein n=1 Tax=Mycena pura TaxID=153505 RepID=A0AAD6V475_9AGAR|nr:hypothetical protein GGX14DRAFT_699309 [Mycena pura]